MNMRAGAEDAATGTGTGMTDKEKACGKISERHFMSRDKASEDTEGIGDKFPRKLRAGCPGKVILVVDDEHRVLDLNREILEAVGYQVLVARNGNEAVEIYRARRDDIALVLLDLIMPGMNGFETYSVLKEMNPSIKVIIVSGFSAEGHVSELLRRGCRAFVRKPFEIEYLTEKIREVIQEG